MGLPPLRRSSLAPCEPGCPAPAPRPVFPCSTAQQVLWKHRRKACLELAGAQAVEENCDCSCQELHPHLQIANTAHSHTCDSELHFAPPSEAKITWTEEQLQVLDSLQVQTQHQPRAPETPPSSHRCKQSQAKDVSLPLPTGAIDSIEHPDHYQSKAKIQGFLPKRTTNQWQN